MLELAEHVEHVDKAAVPDYTREEDATATKESIAILFKQVLPHSSIGIGIY
jgi:hypothetical protein